MNAAKPLSFVEGAIAKYTDRESESGALHAIWILQDRRDELLKVAPVDAFYYKSSKRAARALATMHRNAEPFTRSAFLARVRGDDGARIYKCVAAGLRLDNERPIDATGSLERFAHEVARQAEKRERVLSASGLLDAAEDGDDERYALALRALHAKAPLSKTKAEPLYGDAVFTVDESDEPNPWGLIEGAIPGEGRMLLVAPPSTGKTMFLCEIALTAALPDCHYACARSRFRHNCGRT